jgi:co-chaperonin GroES (HSP10)
MIDKGRILPLRVLLRPIKEEEKTSSGLIYKPIDVIKKKTFA